MKRYLSLIVPLVVVCALVLSGCGTPTQSPATAPAPAASPAPATAQPSPTAAPKPAASPTSAAASKPIVLTFTVATTPNSAFAINAIIPWAKQIGDATQNRVKVDIYYNETLAKQAQAWQAITNGVADMGQIVHNAFPNLTPLTDFGMLPFLTLETAKGNSTVLWKMYEKFPSIQNEFKPNHVLTFYGAPSAMLGTTRKQVKTIDDFKGLKLKIGGGSRVLTAIQALGVVPINITASETYMSLQKNVIDGANFNFDMMSSFKYYEVMKYYTREAFYNANFSIVMNGDKWNSLPKDIQDALTSVNGLNGAQFFGDKEFDIVEAPVRAEAEKAGYPIKDVTLSDSDTQKIIQVTAKPTWDQWVKDMNASGHPDAQQILDTFQQMLKSYTP
jgi:TRAP-type transport system periplasmic protein